jgi:hypothetical protein
VNRAAIDPMVAPFFLPRNQSGPRALLETETSVAELNESARRFVERAGYCDALLLLGVLWTLCQSPSHQSAPMAFDSSLCIASNDALI